MNDKKTVSKYGAEFIGTFFLVFFGCGSMILAQVESSYDGGFIPLVWGMSVSIMIYGLGHISGAHFNPAVTIAFYGLRMISLKDMLGYVCVQCSGALMASGVHSIIWPQGHNFGATFFLTDISKAATVEFVLSFVLMFVITAMATDSRSVKNFAGAAIGMTVALCAFVGGPITAASMNPARSLAPAIFSGNIEGLTLYILMPVIGAFIGAKTYQSVQ